MQSSPYSEHSEHSEHSGAGLGFTATGVLAQLGFWLAFGCVGRGLLAVADDAESLGLAVDPLDLGLAIAAVMLALAPVIARLWTALERRELGPSPEAKLSLGLEILALSCFCLGVGIEWLGELGPVGPVALGLGALGLALAAACMTPASDGAREDALAWSLALLLGQAFAWISTGSLAPGDAFAWCLGVGGACVVAGVGVGFCWRARAAQRAGLVAAHGRLPRALPRLGPWLPVYGRTALLALGVASLLT